MCRGASVTPHFKINTPFPTAPSWSKNISQPPGQVSSIKWILLAHFITPNFTPKIITHKIPTPNTHA